MHILDEHIEFPHVSKADNDGLLAVGGDLSIDRLIVAYKKGIFPWFNAYDPILWWCPDPRFVLYPSQLKVSKSMRQLINREVFKVTYNQAFRQVISSCGAIKRKDQDDTWINEQMIEAYMNLFKKGFAKSVEVWKDEQLVGGLYGVDLNTGVFFGESMFSKMSNASKYGFITFLQNTNYKLVDCQIHSNHLESLGAKHIPRATFMKLLHS